MKGKAIRKHVIPTVTMDYMICETYVNNQSLSNKINRQQAFPEWGRVLNTFLDTFNNILL